MSSNPAPLKQNVPSWLARAITRAIPWAPLIAAILVTGGSYVLAGLAASLCAGAASTIGWVCCRQAAQTADAAKDLKRRQRTNVFMQDALDAIPVPIFVKSRHGRLMMINRAYCDHYGLSHADILGKTSTEISPNPTTLTSEEDRAVLSGGHINKEELLPNPITGAPMHRMVTKALSYTDSSKPVIIGSYYDITNMRLAELTLKESLEREVSLRQRVQTYMQRLIDVIPQPVYVKDAESRYIFVNKAFTKERMLSHAQLIGRTPIDLGATPEKAKTVFDEDQRVIAGEVISKEEYSTHPVTKLHLYRVISKGTCLDEEGRPVVVGSNVDVTVQRLAEQKAQEALAAQTRTRDFLQFVLDALPTPLFVKDADHRYIMTNRAHTEVTGLSAQELLGKSASDIIESDVAATLHAEEDAMLFNDNGEVHETEHAMPNKEGVIRHEILRKVVGRDADGQRVVIGTSMNITTLRQAQEALRQHRDGLKAMIEEQTSDLMRAKETAEKANIAKSQFLSNMSHELRTPMHAVLSFAKLGEERAEKAALVALATETTDKNAEKMRTYFQRIRESGSRLLLLLNDLLDLAKLEAGQMVLQLQKVDIEACTNEALREFEAILLAKKLLTQVSTNGCETHVMADSVRIGQVVRNLLSNAIKFSPEGSCITLSFNTLPAVSEETSPTLELIVADQGLGIPSSELESVFDKFIQSSNTLSNAGGTGLGLPICREIINAHSGEIFARHRTPRGTEFVVRIPTQQAQQTRIDKQTARL